jgi:hypothetical protein
VLQLIRAGGVLMLVLYLVGFLWLRARARTHDGAS